mmetsp:Transcript_2526/g.3675  ORF Transcript_2526/g.3675 Transcript_2526/m.3675 type:complete len:247 (+) Transcript_2526:107-847(+)
MNDIAVATKVEKKQPLLAKNQNNGESAASGTRKAVDLGIFDAFRFSGSSQKGTDLQIKVPASSTGTKRKLESGKPRVDQKSESNDRNSKKRKKKTTSSETLEEMRAREIKKWGRLRDLNLSFESVKFQIVIGAILSKQTQFPVVLKAVQTLKAEKDICPDGKSLLPKQMARCDEVKLRRLLSFVHYNKQKAKHLIQTAKMVLERFRGIVPTLQDHLLLLPGIGPMLSSVVRTVTPKKSEFGEPSEQ